MEIKVMTITNNELSLLKINQLMAYIGAFRNVYIQPHNIPDPDAIASSFALMRLLEEHGIKVAIVYVDSVEKSNSKRMLELFDIPIIQRQENDFLEDDECLILLDTQKNNSNVTCLGSKHIAVIDHHQDIDDGSYEFKDIRPEVGACSSIISSYYKALEIEPSINVSTALVYGIMTDTNNLTRVDSKLDLEVFYDLYEGANLNKVRQIKMNEIGRDDIQAYAKALEHIEIYRNIGFVHIEDCNDSLLGTISDMVYTIEGVTVVVSYARRKDGIKFSVRSGVAYVSASDLVKFIIDFKGVGGGHKEMAGGFMPIEYFDFVDYRELDTYVRYRTINFVERALSETPSHT